MGLLLLQLGHVPVIRQCCSPSMVLDNRPSIRIEREGQDDDSVPKASPHFPSNEVGIPKEPLRTY